MKTKLLIKIVLITLLLIYISENKLNGSINTSTNTNENTTIIGLIEDIYNETDR